MADLVLLLGDPVAQSLSPGFQDAGFEAAGLDWRYVTRQVRAADLASAIDELRSDRHVIGANVTIPLKELVVPLLDELDPLAERLRAVNTISRRGATLRGSNTDVEGFAAAIGECGYRYRDRAAAIVGAGGAARAVAAVLHPAVSKLWVVARHPERARRLCLDLGIDPAAATSFDRLGTIAAEADLVVNATPVDLPLTTSTDGPQVFDLRSRHSREGRAMLLHGGAGAFEIWTGRKAPLDVMRAALDRAAQQRAVQGVS